MGARMKRVAVFLDAGYFWVQLCNVLLGAYHTRAEVIVDYEELRKLMLAEVVRQFGADCQLLRVYWYDGPGTGGKTREHNAIDSLDDFKLRLGTRNGVGSQKGVDGLIIADLISLTQQRAISHALLISGDADITPGIVAAQGMGLRAHLLSLGSTSATSPYLAAEVDLKQNWGLAEAGAFAKANMGTVSSAPASLATAPKTIVEKTSEHQSWPLGKSGLRAMARRAREQIQADPTLASLLAMAATGVRKLPREIDTFLLKFAHRELGRAIEELEKQILRDEFRRLR